MQNTSEMNDLELMASVVQKLHEPLLGTEDVIDDDDDDDMSITLETEEEDDDKPYRFSEFLMGWIVLPALLFLQFFLALQKEENTDFSSFYIYSSVPFFVLSSELFRQTCTEQNITSTTVCVLPEIVMDVVLALLLWDKVAVAYMTLLISLFSLSFYVFVSCLVKAVRLRQEQPATRDELDDSFSGGIMRTCSIC